MTNVGEDVEKREPSYTVGGTYTLSVATVENRMEFPRKIKNRDFPGGPVVETSPSSAGGVGSIPGQGARIPHASRPKKPKHKTEAVL